MKKFLSMILVATMMVTVAGCSSKPASSTEGDKSQSSQSTSQAQDDTTGEKGKWVMAINATFPPFESVDAANPGQFVGVDIDIANYIAEKLNVELEINDMQFSSLVPTMTSGRADIIISGLSPTAERLEVVDFTKPYYYPMNAIIAAKGSDYKELATLEGKKIGVSMGTSYANVAKGVAGSEVLELDSTPLVIQEILAGRCDAGIFDATQAAEFCKQNEGLESYVISSEITMEDTFAIALPKDSEYVEQINTIIDEMMADGTFHDILVKHLGEETTAQYEEIVAGLEIAK